MTVGIDGRYLAELNVNLVGNGKASLFLKFDDTVY